MNINAIYYTEVNLICVVILLILQYHLSKNSEKYSTANKVFRLLLCTTVLLCVSDGFAGIFRGKVFDGARALIESSNLVFFEAMSIIGFLWMTYVFIRLGVIKEFNKSVALWSVPLLIFTLIAATNPFTHLLFTIDENNLYRRNIAAYLHWFVTWMYLIIPTAIVLIEVIREKNRNRKKELIPFLYFIIAPLAAGIFQMLFYGVTTSQVGITISILIIALAEQSSMIYSDSLTGLNNRHGLGEYIATHLQHHAISELALLMIDVNSFKYINDKFGHITGDHALVDVARVLKGITYSTENRLFICRYGGDEFLIASFGCTLSELEIIKKQIYDEFEGIHPCDDAPYDLSVSVGLAHGKVGSHSDVERLLREADRAMYEEKKVNRALKV